MEEIQRCILSSLFAFWNSKKMIAIMEKSAILPSLTVEK